MSSPPPPPSQSLSGVPAYLEGPSLPHLWEAVILASYILWREAPCTALVSFPPSRPPLPNMDSSWVAWELLLMSRKSSPWGDMEEMLSLSTAGSGAMTGSY